MTTYRKKLIEVALPLDAINRESAREKSIRHGHPSTLHLWWARRPLASCRAVIFSSLVDDPDEPKAPKKYLEALDKLEKPPSGADGRREKLFYFIERLVKWESTTDETILGKARELIQLSSEGNPPPVLDPFCGGGSIPLEAQRLGLKAYASDLNPVAVLITKALIEIPPKFAGRPPVNAEDRAKMGADAHWKGAAGLAADVRHYGKWMRERASERIGHLYPKGPNGETVIAWLWARTVKCPNPACGGDMPLVRSFLLSTKAGRKAWVEPVVNHAAKRVTFEVKTGQGNAPAGTKERAIIHCLICGGSVTEKQLRQQASKLGYGQQAMAVVAEGNRGRSYRSPADFVTVDVARPTARWLEAEMPKNPRWFSPPSYGLMTYGDLFTPRQLVALTTFSDLVGEAREQVLADSGGDTDYADAVATYLAFAVDKAANYWSTLCAWHSGRDIIVSTFSRQALPMVWDFAECNPLSDSTGNWMLGPEQIAAVIQRCSNEGPVSDTKQLDAATAIDGVPGTVVATDPPYYDNIGYADLSDFFYVWLRRTLGHYHTELFSTVLTPKAPELIATPYRFDGNRKKAEEHFEKGLAKAFALMRQRASPDYPLTLFYAFRQAESDESAVSSPVSTGWQTMLNGLINEALEIKGTWPMRTELSTNLKKNVNALASSIVLVCRPRPANAPMATFKQFQTELGREFPEALRVMIGHERAATSEPWVDPIDLRQAAIGPGMAVYSRYSRVQKADGTALSVRDALIEINEAIDRYFDEMEGELDPDSRFCVQWYREAGFGKGKYGRAEVLAQATNVGIEALERKGLLEAKGGNVRLLKPEEYDGVASGPSQWELCHGLVGALAEGEEEAARLYNRMPGLAEESRDLAYRLYLEAEKKGWAEDALGYNQLVASWTDIRKRAAQLRDETQGALI
jgi:putative DNA methylase